MDQLNGSRREFLATTGMVAGAALATQAGLATSAYAQGDDVIRIGLVGSGGRGTGAARDALSTDHNVKLVAVGDVFEDRANRAVGSIKGGLGDKGSKVDVAPDKVFFGFDAFKKVIDSGVDLVILATPPGFRPQQFEYAINAGKHVFMEKPVATDAPGVRQVLAASKLAKEKNLKVGCGLQRHHDIGYIETINRIKDGQIGDVIAMRAYWNNAGVWEPPLKRENAKSEMEYQMRNWYYYNWLCGDHIVEQHIHNLDVCNWVKGDYPVRANGMGGRQVRVDKRYGEIYDHHCVEFEYKDGSRTYSQCRHIPNTWNQVSEFVHGSKGTSNPSGSITAAGNDWRYRGPRPNPYVVEHDDLLKAIKGGVAYNEADNGAYSTMTSILGRMATYSGKVIEWNDALNSQISLFPKELSWDADMPVKPDSEGNYPIATPGVTKVV
ncbi:Inositol 2-dehydrogenase [Planctopirus ephydatiae]|uniref:Inositol 2-dehydrogenase n=1 Tax=Planctopirus ephydatiae TaxID=2528019 RepID=A0A518GJY0_9PLAN|nr:Gfo/Idh/MocA family oxidoreductase [Planctopirus ephydatiae]QDV28889.1 Inositol 2-dehydrogenase [Planctopirus ephydatiae]